MEITEAFEEDYPELLRFWNDNSQWDEISMDTWAKRFLITPCGNSIFVIARKDDRIIAHLIFVPLKIFLGGLTVNGCRPFAAVVEKSVRNLAGYKIIIHLYNHSIKLLRKKGVDLMIMLPDPRWKPLIRFIDAHGASYPLFKKNIDDHFVHKAEKGIVTRLIEFYNNEIDDLWVAVKKQDVIMIVRDRQMLEWKNSHRDYKIIGVYKNGKLVGITTFLEKAKDKQIQICDILYENDSVKTLVLSQVSDFITRTYSGSEEFVKVVILVTESFRESLLKIGYKLDDYNFFFVLKRINESLTKEVLDFSKWYLSAND
jgi:hypothetical protein